METIFTNYLIQMVGAAVVLSLIGRLVIYPQRGPKVAKKTVADKQGVSVETLREFLAKFATSSNAIYHLYGSMSHFSARIKGSKENPTETAITGYKDLYGTSIMLTDPLCRKEVVKDAVESFQKFNNSRNLDSILLAVDQTTANAASELGFKLLKIGQEPLFDLQNYDPGKINSKIRSSIRQVEKKGIIVEQVTLAQLFSPAYADPLNELLGKWFMTRGSDRFHLLTEVSPVKACEEKKFFIARSWHAIEGFLACSPMYTRNGYFIHDLLRAPFSMNGVTDALVFHALTQLKSEGYTVASLGVSPLAGIAKNDPKSPFPKVSNLMNWVFENARANYRFKELYHFKKKFLPTSEEPVYIALPKDGIKIRYLLAVISIFANLNPTKQIGFIVHKWRLGYDLPRPLTWAFEPTKILLPPIQAFDFESVSRRLKVTISMVFLNIFAFIYTTDVSGKLDTGILNQHGFSYDHFAEHSWFILVTSNFVHFNYTHLIVNMTLMVLFLGSFEMAAGSILASIVYFVGLEANIPTGLVLLPVLKMISPKMMAETASTLDVGASLGIMCGFGGLVYLMTPKLRTTLTVAAISGFLIYAVASKDLIGIDHAFAIGVGLYVTRKYFGYQPSQKVFDTIERKYFERRKEVEIEEPQHAEKRAS